jgi:predicted anti-sigma-YlaC factor YlaD
MEARLAIARTTDCDEARALASLALDGALTDDLGRRFLHRHVGECAACARFTAEIASATALLRDAPLEPYRCGPLAARRLGPASGAHRMHWATMAAAIVAMAVGVASLPQAADPPTPLKPMVAAVHVPAGPPVKLPIGQKSAESDFADGLNSLLA